MRKVLFDMPTVFSRHGRPIVLHVHVMDFVFPLRSSHFRLVALDGLMCWRRLATVVAVTAT